MQKSSRIIISAALVAGGFLGYFALFPFLSQEQDSSPEITPPPAERQTMDLKFIRVSNSDSQSLPTASTLSSYLIKYTNFSPQEIKEEMARLQKASKDKKTYNYSIESALEYLSYKLAYLSPEKAQRILENKTSPEGKEQYDSLFFDLKPEDSLSLIDKLSSSEKKEEITHYTLNVWLNYAPHNVKSWVEKSALTDDQKKDFIKQCDTVIQKD